jgi:hypothetical protein
MTTIRIPTPLRAYTGGQSEVPVTGPMFAVNPFCARRGNACQTFKLAHRSHISNIHLYY